MKCLPSKRWIAAALGLGLVVTACAPAESDYVGEDRSGLTEEVDARSPVMPDVDTDASVASTDAAE